MRRVVVILPDLLAEDETPSPLRENLPALNRMAEEGSVGLIAPLPKIETPEALYLGLGPDEGQMRQGPLTISALGADPPERSLHFHLSLMTFQEGLARKVTTSIPTKDLQTIAELAKKLNTPKLTIVNGEQTDHGLVWEQFGDLGTTPADDIEGKRLQLPEGDGENLLRRFIDDSINILSEQEFNLIREEEGLPKLNLLWPWGHGIRRTVPNLLFKRGEQALVFSASLRLQGLTRLAGYRHTDRSLLGNGLNAQLEKITKLAKDQNGPTILVLDPLTNLRRAEQIEELHWLLRQIDDRFLTPLIEDSAEHATQITLIATHPGLSLSWDSQAKDAGTLPFDERAFEESRIPQNQLWEAVTKGLSLAE
jgi:2,3-bisphosphoglycerate-independent phosphoglycerate mutase